jgi:hypothetical protein
MKPSDVLETPLLPNQSVMAVINETGDKKTIWDRNNPVEVEAARNEFDFFRKKGHMAYKVEGADGRKGEVLSAFDPKAERIIFAPPMQGGATESYDPPKAKAGREAQIDNIFTYHAPKNDQTERYERLRSHARNLAREIQRCCPESREKSLAITNLQQAIMFANASIAINE